MTEMHLTMEKTKLAKAHSKTTGLKTAVPWSIVKDWNLKSGDYLSWERKILNNEIVIVVKKVSRQD